jgi:hypothetical protein
MTQTAITRLTGEMIEAAIAALPVQGRVMLRLLLLQYLDVSQEDIDYMAADRPDPRFVSGSKPLVQVVARETIQGLIDRVAQYRTRVRQKREQTWLQIECLRNQIAFGEALCAEAERLLTGRFGLNAEALRTLKAGARAAIAKPAIREIDRQWEQDEIAEEAYRRRRLGIEYQTELRKLDRERKRLETALRDCAIASHAPLHDHEIGHIWGIPAGTLAARKAKFLHQYLQGLHAALNLDTAGPAVDLWKETFNVLAGRSVERSTVPYDGLDRTEASLMERLRTFAARMTPEDFESRAWLAISESLFALQRLSTIQAEQDRGSGALEQAWFQRTTPASKTSPAPAAQDAATEPEQPDDWREHILKSMRGEDRR